MQFSLLCGLLVLCVFICQLLIGLSMNFIMHFGVFVLLGFSVCVQVCVCRCGAGVVCVQVWCMCVCVQM